MNGRRLPKGVKNNKKIPKLNSSQIHPGDYFDEKIVEN